MSKKDPNIGNKPFSINFKDVEFHLVSSSIQFYIYYIILVVISSYFIFTLRFQVFESKGYKNWDVKDNIFNLLHSLYKNFHLFSVKYIDVDSSKYIGLTPLSYIIFASLYGLAFIILMKNLLSTLIYQSLFGLVQINPNVNPYSNPNTVSKIPDSPFKDANIQYSKTISSAILLLLPISIFYIVKYMKWSQLEIQRNNALLYIIFGLVLLPPLSIIINSSLQQNIKQGEKYVEERDKNYVDELSNQFQKTFFGFYAPYFLLLYIFAMFYLMKMNLQNWKLTALSFFILFIFLPVFGIFMATQVLYRDVKDSSLCDKSGYDKDIKKALKTGIHNIQQAIIKYNFPCFYK
jgi:hypothetical protein